MPPRLIRSILLQHLKECRALADTRLLPRHNRQRPTARNLTTRIEPNGLIQGRARPDAKVRHELSLPRGISVGDEDCGRGGVFHGAGDVFVEEAIEAGEPDKAL
jgi:hypothetical protein